eukprot:GFUD01003455.1.p1 GENE.GFUD01003455.1~~GFUD01003455.1.p1  ORF type:complete len:472 (+),score=104.48 GFUD01003455.1:24-1418(+)
MFSHLLKLIFLLHLTHTSYSKKYEPNWDSLDSRPAPLWYDEAKFGIFMHWGPYSVPGLVSEWFWAYWKGGNKEIGNFMEKNYPPSFQYQEFGPLFKAEFFNASEWANIVASSGAKYFVLTSKHHDGFANWPSSRNFGWNARDIGPKRDVVGELSDAFRADGKVRFGLYHSLFEWFHPLYLQDKNNNFTTRNFVTEKMGPELMELVSKYKPDVLWSDGDWEAEDSYWGSLEFLAWLYSDSPVKDSVLANDRWGRGIPCKHGDIFTCTDRYNPGLIQAHKWENAMTVDKISWGHRRNMKIEDVMSVEELIRTLAETVSCGGNLLMNVGPDSSGVIPAIFQERMMQMGSWLEVNGEAIYSSKPWSFQNDTLNSNVWYTSKVDKEHGEVVYAIILDWPESGMLDLGCPIPGENTRVELLGFPKLLQWRKGTGVRTSITVEMPDRSQVSSQWSWVVKLVALENSGNYIG